jgi:hypothetical protein
MVKVTHRGKWVGYLPLSRPIPLAARDIWFAHTHFI